MCEDFVDRVPVNFTDFKCQLCGIVSTILQRKNFLKFINLFLCFSDTKDSSNKIVVSLNSNGLLVFF